MALVALEAVVLAITSQVEGILVVPSALVAVTLMFGAIPVTGWLIGRYVAEAWRSRAFAAEYVLSLGMSSIVVPVIAVLHQAGYGFDSQYLLFALSAPVVAAGAFALPGLTRASNAPLTDAR